MSETKGSSGKSIRGFLWLIVLAMFIYLIVRNIGVWVNVLKVLLGFGSVILIHEFGHFIVAKLSGIKVETFSIFMPPTLLGVQRTEKGLRFRVLPRLVIKEKEVEEEEDSEEEAEEEKATDGEAESKAEAKGDTEEQVSEVESKAEAKGGAEELEEESLLSLTIGKGGGKAWDTEYRIGLIPLGGFVKMLGQEDIGDVKSTDDPRSFANKSVGIRAAVISAGVIFNVISAVIIFMVVFLVGIKLAPPVVGAVRPGSPAALAGLKAGDEVIEIAGKSKDLDFSHIGVAAALSDINEVVPIKVRHEDGKEDVYQLKAVEENTPMGKMKRFGIAQAYILTIDREITDVNDVNMLRARTGLQPGDIIKAVDGENVQTHWDMVRLVENTVARSVTFSAERTKGAEKGMLIDSLPIDLEWRFAERYEIESESELYHIYSIVPRLQVLYYSPMPEPEPEGNLLSKLGRKMLGLVRWIVEKAASLFGREPETEQKVEPALLRGDIILAAGEVENPTYKELREVVQASEDEQLPIRILRVDANDVEQELTVKVVPRRLPDSDWVQAGIGLALDAAHPVVARTIDTAGGPVNLGIPPGATIVAVDGAAVSSFYDIVEEISKYKDERITIDYRVDEQRAGSVALNVGGTDESITVKSVLTEVVPFDDMERLYQADGPVEAVVMGGRKTCMFITQTYVTLKRLVGRSVSPKNLMGPVGILTITYRIAKEKPVIVMVYFLGLISAVIAVFNFLPVPPLDGGLIALLIVEKIKGSALSERVQTIAVYAGWVAIGGLFLYVTFNDIVRSFFS